MTYELTIKLTKNFSDEDLMRLSRDSVKEKAESAGYRFEATVRE